MKLILAAFEPELLPLNPNLVHAGGALLGLTGVGAIEAAVRTAFLLKDIDAAGSGAQHRHTEVLFIGSCGAVDDTVPLLSSVVFSSVTLAAGEAVNNSAFFPEPMQRKLNAGGTMHKALLAEHPSLEAHAFSTLAITRDRSLGKTLAHSAGAHFENLELFGVAMACEQLGVPWSALSTVTNYIHENGHAEWLANHVEAAARTAILVESLLKSPHLK